MSEETRAKLSIKRRLRVTTDETRKKLSETHKRIGTKPPILKGEANGFFGKKHSEETLAKIKETKSRNKGIT